MRNELLEELAAATGLVVTVKWVVHATFRIRAPQDLITQHPRQLRSAILVVLTVVIGLAKATAPWASSATFHTLVYRDQDQATPLTLNLVSALTENALKFVAILLAATAPEEKRAVSSMLQRHQLKPQRQWSRKHPAPSLSPRLLYNNK